MLMTEELYIKQEHARAKKHLYNRERKAFGSSNNLADWFVKTLLAQKFKCHYCDTSIFDINILIDAGLLKTRAVRGVGRRGPSLEIDKNDMQYSPEKCVLACYYCNNDKSYTSTKEEYKLHFGPNRGKFFKQQLEQLKKNETMIK